MLGAIAGDVIGSVYEHRDIKTKHFDLFDPECRFTDDTVCTLAIAACLLEKGNFSEFLGNFACRYKSRGFGGMFIRWAHQWKREPYDSWGNGSAMRVSPVAYWMSDKERVLELAKRTSEVTHSHPDGVIGAQATALAIWLSRNDTDPENIRSEIECRFGYDLSQTVDEIRLAYKFDVSAAGSVPQAIICALEASDYEDAVRNAISIGGDSDTIACITGGIAEALFGLPDDIAIKARGYLNDELLEILDRFEAVTDVRGSRHSCTEAGAST